MKLTVIIPAYNEANTVSKITKRVLSNKLVSEIIIVNDGSTDRTNTQCSKLKAQYKKIKLINKIKNQGKGAAIRDALKIAGGDVFIIQDADLEYDPAEYHKLILPIINKKAEVVYGSRFVGGDLHRVLYFWHFIGNKLISFLANCITDLNLSDIETCYKAFTKQVAQKLNIQENRFGFESEFTIKVSRMHVRVSEVGISYSGRSYSEGKKIKWQDGLWTIWCLVKYGLIERIGLSS